MDPVVSHALAGAIGATPALLGAVGYAIRSRANAQQKIADAVVDAMKDMRADMEQTKDWAQEALAMAKTERDERTNCEARCDALKNELDELRREVRSGHTTRHR